MAEMLKSTSWIFVDVDWEAPSDEGKLLGRAGREVVTEAKKEREARAAEKH